MKLQDIRAFVAVAETGSVNRAALRLHLTQPATTRRLQNFEAAMGGPLLDRSTKPPTLTPAGRQALEHCRRVLLAVADLETGKSGEPTGNFRLGIAHGLTDLALTAPLDALRRRFPRLNLRVGTDWTTRLIAAVHAGELDCAVGLLGPAHHLPPGLKASPVGREDVTVLADKATARRLGNRKLRLRDLAGEPWVLNPPGCGCRAALERAFDRARQPMRLAAEILEEELQLSLVARRAGLGLMPLRQVQASSLRKQLAPLALTDFSLKLTVAVLQGPALGQLEPAAAELHRRLTESLGDART